MVTTSDSCTTCYYLTLTCFPGWCISYRAILDVSLFLSCLHWWSPKTGGWIHWQRGTSGGVCGWQAMEDSLHWQSRTGRSCLFTNGIHLWRYQRTDKCMYCKCHCYISTEGTVALPNSFTPGAFPEYRLNCTQLSNGTWHCSPVEQQCDSFVELGVVCKNYEDIYKECSRDYAPSKLPVTTSQSPTTQQGKLMSTTSPK